MNQVASTNILLTIVPKVFTASKLVIAGECGATAEGQSSQPENSVAAGNSGEVKRLIVS